MKKLVIMLLKRWKTLIKVGVAGLVLYLILKEFGSQLVDIDFVKTFKSIRHLPMAQLLALFVLGLLATSTMTLYDYAVIGNFSNTLTKPVFFCISFVANALNNLLGMGGLAGATTRTVMLKKGGNDLSSALYYNILLAPATPTGLSLLALYLILESRVLMHLSQHYVWLTLGLVVMLIYLPMYLFSDKLVDRIQLKYPERVTHRSLGIKGKLIAISLLEWVSAALFFLYIAKIYSPHVSVELVIGVYSIAAIAGIMSFLPGGIGSFDLIAIIGLEFCGIKLPHAVAILMIFRVFYYFIPAILGIAALLISLSMDRTEKLYQSLTDSGFSWFKSVQRFYQTFSDLIGVLVAVIVFFGGVVLLISAAKPGIEERVRFMSHQFSNETLSFMHSASILFGFLMMLMAVEILYKVKRSYKITLMIIIGGAVTTFLKGFDYEEVLYLFLVLSLLKLTRHNFYRESIPVRLSRLVWIGFVGSMSIFTYFVLNKHLYDAFLAKRFYPVHIFADRKDVLIHSLLISGVFIAFLVVMYLTKVKMESDSRFERPDFAELKAFLSQHQGDALTHLYFLGDKHFFWAVQRQVLFAFSKYQDVVVVLGDPIGPQNLIGEAIHEFQVFLDTYGYEAVFYEVGSEQLTTYHDNGFYFFKLGEEAIVDVESFSMAGAAKSNLRNNINKLNKAGYTFEILQPPFDKTLLDACEDVSKEWLGNRKEMGFSMGWFDREYLQLSDMAVFKSPEGLLLAFVSIMPSYDQNESASTDLMRLRGNVPHGTMDYLIIHLIMHFKTLGLKTFSLGMAPLSNVGVSPYSHLKERIARMAFQYGRFFYSFEGLRKYKEKFDPVWRPRYLAYPQLISLPSALLEVSLLVSSQRKFKKKFGIKPCGLDQLSKNHRTNHS